MADGLGSYRHPALSVAPDALRAASRLVRPTTKFQGIVLILNERLASFSILEHKCNLNRSRPHISNLEAYFVDNLVRQIVR